MAGNFHVSNKMPAKNPCEDLKADDYNNLRKAVDDVINSPVIDDIDKTVDKTLADDSVATGSVDVEVNVVTDAASYKKSMHDADTDASDEDMQNWFDNDVAHTDIVGKEGHRKIVVNIFCGDHLRMRLVQGGGARTFIHELTHAQLYATSIRGLPQAKEPYPENDVQTFIDKEGRTGHADEHNEKFSKTVERLTKLFESSVKKDEKPKTAKTGTSKTGDKTKKKAEVKRHGKKAEESASAPASSGVQFSIGVGFGGLGGGRGGERRGSESGLSTGGR